MSNQYTYQPIPKEIILKEYLNKNGASMKEAAKVIGCTRKEHSKIHFDAVKEVERLKKILNENNIPH